MIYKLFSLIILSNLLGYNSIAQQSVVRKSFRLSVDVSSMKPRPERMMITYFDYLTRRRISDTVIVSSSRVVFKGVLTEPVMAQLNQYPPLQEKVSAANYAMSGRGGSTVNYYGGTSFFLEPGHINLEVRDSIKSIDVKGCVAQKVYEQLQLLKKPYSLKQREWLTKMTLYAREKDSVNLQQATDAYGAITTELREAVYKPFIKEQARRSPVVLIALQEFASFGKANYDEFESLFQSIAPEYQVFPSALAMKQRVFTTIFTSIGAVAPNFTQNDTLDRPVSLSSFRGKYVLLDFWASWCGPCRKENPNLVKSFQRFKDKGFTILGVSLDQAGKKDAWLKAIHEDQLTWTHVSDLAFWDNAAARMYGITGVPANFLIDPQGKIIARNLRGDALDKKLAEILGH